MAYNTKINLSDDKVCQGSGDLLTLSGNTVISASGSLNYAQQPTWTGDTQVATKKYVDDAVVSATGSTVYDLASPSTVEVGGLLASSILTGNTSNQLLEKILVKYLTPTFSNFSSEMSTTVEMGTVLSGIKSFNWNFTNGGNVQALTMCIYDANALTNIATNVSTTSPVSADIGTKTFNGSCGQTFAWKGCAQNSCSAAFGSSNHTITGYYPYFWGVCTCPGAAGANRPSLTAAQITGGSKVLAGSAGSFGINFSSTDNDYLWFAVPATVSNKSCWYIDIINNGLIGGGVSPGCNLFPAPVVVNNVQNACWSSVDYDVYVSNKQTSTSASMTIT